MPAKEQPRKSNRKKLIAPLIIILAGIAIFITVFMNDDASTSNVEGVSDEVYEQLVQFYFYTTTFVDMFQERHEGGPKIDARWIEDHNLYKEAETYTEEHDHIYSPVEVFPNPLFVEHANNQGAYSETEQHFIKKMGEFLETLQRLDLEEHERLKVELKEELRIKDTYNPFDV